LVNKQFWQHFICFVAIQLWDHFSSYPVYFPSTDISTKYFLYKVMRLLSFSHRLHLYSWDGEVTDDYKTKDGLILTSVVLLVMQQSCICYYRSSEFWIYTGDNEKSNHYKLYKRSKTWHRNCVKNTRVCCNATCVISYNTQKVLILKDSNNLHKASWNKA